MAKKKRLRRRHQLDREQAHHWALQYPACAGHDGPTS